MFRETVTSADGTTAEGTCSDEHAAGLLRTAARRGYRIEATRQGGAVITREVRNGGRVPRERTVTLEPTTPVGRLTPTVRRHLDVIAAASGAFRVDATEGTFRNRTGRISAGFSGVSPSATTRLAECGLIVFGTPFQATSNGFMPETRTPVTLSLAARLAMLAQDHRTETRRPRGYVHPADIGVNSVGRCKGGGRSGLIYDRSSAASCSCHGWSYPAEDRDSARRAARTHREAASAALVPSLMGATA